MGIPSFIKQYSQIFCVAKGDCCRNLSNNGTMCSHVLPSCLVPKFHGALNTGKPNRYFLRDHDPHFKLRSPKASAMQVRVWVGVKFHCWWSFDRTFWGKDRRMIGVDMSQQPFLLQWETISCILRKHCRWYCFFAISTDLYTRDLGSTMWRIEIKNKLKTKTSMRCWNSFQRSGLHRWPMVPINLHYIWSWSLGLGQRNFFLEREMWDEIIVAEQVDSNNF